MSSAHSSSESRCAPSSPHSASCSGAWRPAPSATSSPSTSANNRRDRPRSGTERVTERVAASSPGRGRSRGWAARGSSSINSIRTPSGSRTHARRAPGRPSGSVSGGVPAAAARSRVRSRSDDRNGHHRVADVARPPVRRQRAHEGAPELEQLDLEEVLAVDQPPAGRGRARHALHHRGERTGEQVGAARGLQPEHLPVPALGPAQVGDAERDLAQAHRADPSRGGVAQSRVSSPTVSGSGSSATRRTASRTPGMNERRSVESWRIESVWPSPPKITS